MIDELESVCRGIYSGGLGVLSGDHVKSASGLGVPLVAIGLFYDQGYFKQHLDADGWQQYRRWITKAPAPRGRRVGIDPSLYTWKGYRSWSEQVKRNWNDDDET